MKKLHNKVCQKYYNNVKKEFPFAYASRKSVLNDLEKSLCSYENEHSNFIYADLENDFGSATEFADSVFETEDACKIRNALFFTTKFKIIFTALVIAIFLLIFMAVKSINSCVTKQVVTIDQRTIYTTSPYDDFENKSGF